MKRIALPLALLALSGQAPAPPPAPKVLAPSEIVAGAPAADWVDIAASDLLVMDLAGGKRVVIQLMPAPFSQGWVGNIRKLAAARFWDGTSINRVQDNYVVQWGDANAEDQAKAKKLPEGLVTVPQSEYQLLASENGNRDVYFPSQSPHLPLTVPLLAAVDAYALSEFHGGWPLGVSLQGKRRKQKSWVWPVHCYGMVGVGRDMPPDTGTGAELYTVIGHAPRHLDRNIALVGRVIAGIEHLSSLPRGTGALGFYEKPEQRVTITSIRLGNEVTDLPRYQYLSTESASFARYADARANRRDAFFIVPAGGADICNIPVPVRVMK
jgi:cyclophilin family peptidyl-prolyl cis-trans isomerase